ncbi:MAG: hypothetical protein HYU97_05605 [Deltaproteobacteria bacterium]|nr:hypothetical protein [Deltaproteobacteria bacterium]
MPKGLKIAVIVFHINAACYALFSVFFGFTLIYVVTQEKNQTDLIAGTIVCVGFVVLSLIWAAFNELTIWGLKKYKFWAWVCGIIISGLNVFSICMPLGILSLVGLLVKDTQPLFQKSKQLPV